MELPFATLPFVEQPGTNDAEETHRGGAVTGTTRGTRSIRQAPFSLGHRRSKRINRSSTRTCIGAGLGDSQTASHRTTPQTSLIVNNLQTLVASLECVRRARLPGRGLVHRLEALG